MLKQSKKRAWIFGLILLGLCFAFHFNSCKEADRTSRIKPVEVAVSQKVSHSPFQATIARFESKLAQDVAEDGVGSISAGVVVGNDLVWAKGFGWADIERKIPADKETIYRTGSISKSFTAVLMMQMAEDGFFGLDDPVEKYFPAINNLSKKPENSPSITFRHLASHTAGLNREPKLRDAARGPISQWENKILSSIPQTSFRSSPGEQYSYSNIGFGILGLAVSRASGTPFIELVREHIFEPQGMKSSFFILTAEYLPHMAMGYVKRKEGTVSAEFPALEHAGRGYKVPNGGIYSTVGDLAKFIAGMTGAAPLKLFSEETRLEILKRQTPEGGGGYGLGFSIRIDKEGFQTIGHGGSVAGYNASMIFEPKSKIGVIIFRNYSRGKTNLGRASRALLKELTNVYNSGKASSLD